MRFKRFSAVLVFSLLSGVGLIQYLSYKDSHPSTEDAYVQAHIVNIASRVSGPVIKLHVSENDYVNAGDVLFEIDPSVFDAIVQGASANYELAAQSTGASDAEVGVAKSTLEERKVSLSRAKRALERATSLAQKKLISEINSVEAEKLIYNEIIHGGMIPKIRTCINAVNNDVRGVVIIDGRKPHSILFELFSDKGAGTLIRK